MRSGSREAWEVVKTWWLFVPGGALGVVAIVQVIHDARSKTVWFWGFCAVTALCLALCVRLWKVVKERDQARVLSGYEQSFGPWLDERSRAIKALRDRLRDQIDGQWFNPRLVDSIVDAFWETSNQVLARLHIDAPDEAEHYIQNPPWFREGLTRMLPEQFEEVVKVMDYTLDQIARIQARLSKEKVRK